MKGDIAFNFSQVTEAAALAGYKWLGRGDKNVADNAAVEAMRLMLNQMAIEGEIVIGEGEIDEAPMLYIGEQVGQGGYAVDIAVDPIDGTRMTAMGQGNAIAVLAAAEKGSFLKAPDMYMEKLVCGPAAAGKINLELPLVDNLKAVAQAQGKPLTDLTVTTLAKPRHDKVINILHQLGVRVFAAPDGDVAASLLTCMPESEVDLMYCIGGAPEGVVSAAAMKAMGGDMQGRLLLRSQAKGESVENLELDKVEQQRCQDLGVEPGQLLTLDDMVKTDQLVFAATGITKGDVLDGIVSDGVNASTETLLIRGSTGSIRKIRTVHKLKKKDLNIQKIIL